MASKTLAEYLRSQKEFRREIEVYISNYKKTSVDRHSEGYLNARLNGVAEPYNNFGTTHRAMISTLKSSDCVGAYFDNDEVMQVKELYWDFVATVQDALHEFRQRQGTSVAAPINLPDPNQSLSLPASSKDPSFESKVKLPRISIPKFTGQYEDWQSFADLFQSVIHNDPNLSQVEKLQYLKTAVIGEAEQLLKHLQITEGNYKPAWGLLQNRYDNKRMLTDTQFRLLFDQPKILKDSAESIKRLLDTTNESLNSLQNLKLDITNWDPILNYILVDKLPKESRMLWEQKISESKDLATFDMLSKFLEARFRTLESVSESSSSSSFQRSNRPAVRSFAVATGVKCILCAQQHSIRTCNKFLNLQPTARIDVSRHHNLCINCLSHTHNTKICPSTKTCFTCGKRHHTLLHITQPLNGSKRTPVRQAPIANPKSEATAQVASPEFNSFHSETNPSNKTMILATALVLVQGEDRNPTLLRALIDPCSMRTFITERAAQTLKVKRHATSAVVHGLAKSNVANPRHEVDLTIKSVTNQGFSITTRAFILKTLTSWLPAHQVPNRNWPHLRNLPLADPKYYQPGRIDMLIGADVYPYLVSKGVRKGPLGSPIAQRTAIGWILTGEVQTSTNLSHSIVTLHQDIQLSDQIRKFWEVEELPHEAILSLEDKACEELYDKTSSRDVDGRFTVRLPFRPNSGMLGRSRDIALRQFLQLEKRLTNNPVLQSDYTTCINAYKELHHMRISQDSEGEHQFRSPFTNTIAYQSYYIPHHAVFKESTTTKLRVVFNASSKTTSGISLNDILMKGPTLQDDLFSIVLRWRKHKVVFCADLEKMYRQIRVHSDDTQYQKILWRQDPTKPLLEYVLETVTFGMTCAPFLAIKTIQCLARTEMINFPEACQVIMNDFYVDDVLSGGNTLEEVKLLQRNLIDVFKKGGFDLRKWHSNSKSILAQLPSDYLDVNSEIELEKAEHVKTLGVSWYPKSDSFAFRVNIPNDQRKITKRSMLSDIARLFDPLGWLAPTILLGKLFLQKLWVLGLDWDEVAPEDITQEWKRYKNDLITLQDITLPRWIGYQPDVQYELHGFCDASTKAYGAVVYARITDKTQTTIHLLAAKTKVAPIIVRTLPHLELCGALLLGQLLSHVQKSMKIPPNAIYAWCDSSVTLQWITSDPSKWKTYVANRVANIQRLFHPNIWRYVPTDCNPADLASRGLIASSLQKCTFWWSGPPWLSQPKDAWPAPRFVPTTNLETKPETINRCMVICDGTEFITRFSTLNRLLRITTLCLRFSHYCRHPTPGRKGQVLTANDLRETSTTLVKITQTESFQEELRSLKAHRPISHKSRLLSLAPFLDEQQVLRVQGRLQNSNQPYNTIHPIILPHRHHFTYLIIQDAHERANHGGIQLTQAVISETYWILQARSTIKSILHKCMVCFKNRPTTARQMMGNLPQPRVTIARPFSNTGVDYAGPITFKAEYSRVKTYKGYIVIFVCLATKAIHLEAAADLTAAEFISTLRRFASRRGSPAHLYSDCGTNLIGANKILIAESAQQQSSVLSNFLAKQGISWHFNPPAAPHFGGLWEAGVKSTKYHLKRILGNAVLTYKEFSTVLTQIEACLNSRPLCPLSNDPKDLNPLTPAHFLIGESLLAVPDLSLDHLPNNRLNRYQYQQRLIQDFWSRWTTEYLNRLQNRPKWARPAPMIKIDQLVLVKNENLPPTQWALGRILTTHPGKDGIVRVVDIKVNNGTLRRPIHKLCVLPIEENQ